MGRPPKFKSGNLKRFDTRLPEEMILKLKSIAKREGRDGTDVMRLALAKGLEILWPDGKK